MNRFYYPKYPVKGEHVIVSIDDNSTLNIKCSLLEYNSIQGMICSVEKSRLTSKALKKLKLGDIIPVLCSEVFIKNENGKEIIFVDLIYSAIDKERFKIYKDRYEKIKRIIDSFTDLVKSTYKEMSETDIKTKVKSMVKESLHTLTKDNEIIKDDEVVKEYGLSKEELVSLFYVNTMKLHEIASSWTHCNSVPNFMECLIKNFPKIDITINITIEMSSIRSFGTQCIKDTCKLISDKIKSHDDKVNFVIKLLSIPNYHIIIKLETLTEHNVVRYFNHVCNLITECANKNLMIEIKNHLIETSNEKIINVLTDVNGENQENEKIINVSTDFNKNEEL